MREMRDVTKRELRLAELVSRGWTDRQIADEVGIGHESVKTKLYQLRLKLGLDNRVMLAVWYVRHHEVRVA